MSTKKEPTRRTSPRTAHNSKISEETAARLKRQKTPLYPPSFTNPIVKTSLTRPSTRLSTSSIASGSGSGINGGGNGSPHHLSSKDSISSANNNTNSSYGHSPKKKTSPKNKQPSSPRNSTATNAPSFTTGLMKTKRYVTKYNSPKNASPTSGSTQQLKSKTNAVSASSFTPSGLNSPTKSKKTKYNNEIDNTNNGYTTVHKKSPTKRAETTSQKKLKSDMDFYDNENTKSDKNIENDQIENDDISDLRHIRRISFEPVIDHEFEIARSNSIDEKPTGQKLTTQSYLGNYSEPIENKSNYLIQENIDDDDDYDNNEIDNNDGINFETINIRRQPIINEQNNSNFNQKNGNDKADVTNKSTSYSKNYKNDKEYNINNEYNVSNKKEMKEEIIINEGKYINDENKLTDGESNLNNENHINDENKINGETKINDGANISNEIHIEDKTNTKSELEESYECDKINENTQNREIKESNKNENNSSHVKNDSKATNPNSKIRQQRSTHKSKSPDNYREATCQSEKINVHMLNEKTIVAELKPQLTRKATFVDSSVQPTNEDKTPNSMQNFDVFSNNQENHHQLLNDQSISTDTKVLGNQKMISVIDIVQISDHKDSSSQPEKGEKRCSYQNMNNDCVAIQPATMIDQSIQPEKQQNCLEIKNHSIIAEFQSTKKSEIATEPSQNERNILTKNEIITEISPNSITLDNSSKSVIIEVKPPEAVKMIDESIQRDENKTQKLEINSHSTIVEVKPNEELRKKKLLVLTKENFVAFEIWPNKIGEEKKTKLENGPNLILADFPLIKNSNNLKQSICTIAEINPLKLADESTQLELKQKNFEIDNHSTVVDIGVPERIGIGTEPSSQININKSISKIEVITDFEANKKAALESSTKSVLIEVQPQTATQMTDEAIQKENQNQNKLEIQQPQEISIEPKLKLVENTENEEKNCKKDNSIFEEKIPTPNNLNERGKSVDDCEIGLNSHNNIIIQEIETEFQEVSEILKRLKSEKLFNIEFPADLLQ